MHLSSPGVALRKPAMSTSMAFFRNANHFSDKVIPPPNSLPRLCQQPVRFPLTRSGSKQNKTKTKKGSDETIKRKRTAQSGAYKRKQRSQEPFIAQNARGGNASLRASQGIRYIYAPAGLEVKGWIYVENLSSNEFCSSIPGVFFFSLRRALSFFV